MELTDEKPGKKLGFLLHALLEEVLEDPAKNDEKWLKERVLELNRLPLDKLQALAEAGREKQAQEEAAALAAIAKEHKV